MSDASATSADQRALERAHVGGDTRGEQLRGVVGELDAVVARARLRRIATARGEVGALDVGHEAGGEALAQAFLEVVEVAGEAVARDHELAAGVVERVEGVEELLLAARLALEELDVVDQQHVDAAEARLNSSRLRACSAARNAFVNSSAVA